MTDTDGEHPVHAASGASDAPKAALTADLCFYAVSLLFALATAIWSEFYGYRVWGNFATAGYALALALTATRTGSRWIAASMAGVLGILVPLAVLVVRRDPGFRWGPWPWSFPSQPEVWVVERSARLLIDNGTPYPKLGANPIPDDYTPYGPAMTVFGLPRALLGDTPLTDARIWFVLVSALAIALTLRVIGRPPVPVSAAQLAVLSPLTALTASVAGDDLPVIALAVLATALAYRHAPAWAGVLCAVVVAMKLTALPAVAVIAVGVAAVLGRRALGRFAAALIVTGATLVVPVLLRDPESFVEHVIRFPLGTGKAHSPAESPFPGHLIASLGPVGHVAAIAVLAVAGCLITAWLVLRPPRSEADAMLRMAVGLGTATLLAPASRWGYLVYPLAMLGAMILFRAGDAGATSSSSWSRRRARAG